MSRTTAVGFIVHGFVQGLPGKRGSRLAYLGRLDDGRTFAAVFEPFRPHFYVRESDSAASENVLNQSPETTASRTMDGEAVVRISTDSVGDHRRAAESLRSSGVRTYEADFNATDPVLMEHNIHGSLEIKGEAVAGRHVDLVFRDPIIRPAGWDPVLTVLSMDIETSPEGEVIAISLVSNGAWGEPVSEVHLLSEPLEATWIHTCDSESALLTACLRRIREIDPDIITGWNVIDFDFEAISRRLKHHGIRFNMARSDQEASFLDAVRDNTGRRQNAAVSCQGRQIIDGLRLLRYGPERFADRKLDSVAHAVLGEGKTVSATGKNKVEELVDLYRDDKVRFADYCRTDADLVLRILDRTGLLDLTIKRCLLIGISLNRAWTSIPGFEFLYTEELHNRSIVAPTAGVDLLPRGEAPGGAILKPEPGVFRNVMVFDFKSLYPSIMRTFNIDPLLYINSEEGYPEGGFPPADPTAITAPNGARFQRSDGILPELLNRFWTNRDEAKRRGDHVASFVYKIIMNSFYGVLGSHGCRFAGDPFAGAITGFGQYLLHWTRDRFREAGLRVLYGDTDSLFVQAGDEAAIHDVELLGENLCVRINGELTEFVREHFDVESRLQLEFEKTYVRFYLPRIRSAGPRDSNETRGRAKGYAGKVSADDGTSNLEIKGMEAIRSDWTRAAGNLQKELLELLLSDASNEEIEQCIRERIGQLLSGELDEELVYSRRLRKGVSGYTKTSPPHVQAARLLPSEERGGTISYLITEAGPQPTGRVHDAIDYAHYLQKQIKPIAEPICDVLGIDTDGLFDSSGQLSLF